MTLTPLSSPIRRLSKFKLMGENYNRIVIAAGLTIFIVLTYVLTKDTPGIHFRIDLGRFLDTPPMVHIHLTAALMAFVTGSVLLIGVKGTTRHRVLGYLWVGAMTITALSSFILYGVTTTPFSWIHALSAWTLIAMPMGLAAARRRNIKAHARQMTGAFVGGMLVAGLFTFLPGRLMWSIFFGV
jgi:uncharacterized membrane protein